jgi:CheY-like chemotaxis protein
VLQFLPVPHEQAYSCPSREDLRTILRDFLSASGYTVIEAVNGAESVAKAAFEYPDLVLMDIQLPVLDGYGTPRGKSRHYPASQQFPSLP